MGRSAPDEATLGADFYRSEHYFSSAQWLSFLEQVNKVRSRCPRTVLEVGVGAGITSAVLRHLGYELTTVDVNEALHPDCICDVTSLTKAFHRDTFDLVLCAEVLEHLPYSEACRALGELAEITREWVVISVPWTFRQLLGLKVKLPRMREMTFRWGLRTRGVLPEHHWELGSIGLKAFTEELTRHFIVTEVQNCPNNPYHWFFVLRKKTKIKR